MEAEAKLRSLYKQQFGVDAVTYTPFSGSGSSWRFRARLGGGTASPSVIGVCNPRGEENTAFIEFGKTFLSSGLRVPHVFCMQGDCYLEQDLGDMTLDRLITERGGAAHAQELIYKAVRLLPHFQISGGKNINYDYCYAFKNYGKDSVLWDVGYFKRCLLDILSIPYDAHQLQVDATVLADYIDAVPQRYFVNRDYQNRNIMVTANEDFVLIDYQQGRRGALQYDVAKYLAQPSLALTEQMVAQCLEQYLEEAMVLEPHLTREVFFMSYPAFELIQGLQRLGGYGNMGLIQKIGNFSQKVIPAIRWFARWLEQDTLELHLPEIKRCLKELVCNYESYLKEVR